MFVVAFVLIGGVELRHSSQEPAPEAKKPKKRSSGQAEGGRPTAKTDPLIDDEMAEIQAILKKRGIS